DRLAVEAELGEVGREGLAHRHVKGVDEPLATRVVVLADGDVVGGLEGTAVAHAERVLDLQHGRPEPSVGGVVKRPWVAHERLALVGGVAGRSISVGDVWHPEEVLRADRPPLWDVAGGVKNRPLGVHTLEDEPRRRGYRHVGRVAPGPEIRAGGGGTLLSDGARGGRRRRWGCPAGEDRGVGLDPGAAG